MYRDLEYFKDIHIVSKFISLIITILAVIILENVYGLMLFAFSIYLIFRNINYLIIELILAFLGMFFNPFDVVLKVIFIYQVVVFFVSTIDIEQVRYFLECLFYSKKHSKFSYISLYICYFFKYYYEHFKEFILLKNSYGKSLNFSFLRYIIVQSVEKTRNKINKLMLLYRYRFYHFSSSRTYMEKYEVTSVDLKYVLIFVIIFLIIFVYGR